MRSQASGLANPMTTAGDLIAGDTDGAPKRLAVGTDGQVLTVTSGEPVWADAAGGGADASSLVRFARGNAIQRQGETHGYIAGHVISVAGGAPAQDNASIFGPSDAQFANVAGTAFYASVNKSTDTLAATWADLPRSLAGFEISEQSAGNLNSIDHKVNAIVTFGATNNIQILNTALQSARNLVGFGCLESYTGDRNLCFFTIDSAGTVVNHAFDDGGAVALVSTLDGGYWVEFVTDSVDDRTLASAAVPTSITINVYSKAGALVDSHTFTSGLPASVATAGFCLAWSHLFQTDTSGSTMANIIPRAWPIEVIAAKIGQ